MDWKDSFSPDILAHGWDLFRNHQIGQIYKQDNIYEARFPDHNRTNAIVNDGFVESVSCTCPRSQYGQLCEHEAALLFALEHPASKPETPKSAPFAKESAKPVSKPVLQEECEKPKPETDFFRRPAPAPTPKSASKPDDDALSLLDELERLFGLEASDLEPKPQPNPKPETVQKPNLQRPVSSIDEIHPTTSGPRNWPHPAKMDSHPDTSKQAKPVRPDEPFHPLSTDQPHTPDKPKQPDFWNQRQPTANATLLDDTLHPEKRPNSQAALRTPQRGFPESKTPFEDLWHALQAKSNPAPKVVKKEPVDEPFPNEQPKPQAKPGFEKEPPVFNEEHSQLHPQPSPIKPAFKTHPEQPHPVPSFGSTPRQPEAKQPAAPKPEPKPVEVPKPQQPKPADSFLALLESLKPNVLNPLLDAYGKTHPAFKDFILAGSLESNPDAIGLILEEARTRLKACLVQDGSFHPRQASQQAAAFTSWLNDQIMALVQARQEASAADLLQSVLVDLNESVYDDDDLEVDQLVDQIFTMYDHLLSGSPAPVIKETFSWLESHLTGPKPMIFDREMIKFVQKPDFDREELASLKFNLLLQILENKDRFLLGPIYRRQLIRSILALLDTFPELEAQAVPFSQMYGSQPYVLLERAKQALDENKLQKAQLLLKKARTQKLTSTQEEEVCRMLIAIYTAQEQPDLALRELKELIFVLQAADPDDVFKLQELESEQEWAEDFKQFEAIAPVELLILAYDRLGLDDKLLSALEQKPNIHDLILYEDRLTKVDPDRTAKLWLVNAKSIAKQANERHDYHRIAAALKKAAAHPATHDEALQFAAELKEMNHRRKALLEELEHAGF